MPASARPSATPRRPSSPGSGSWRRSPAWSSRRPPPSGWRSGQGPAAHQETLAGAMADLGRDFGAGLTEAEVRWLVAREYARTAEDIVWRRTKLGLRMTAAEIAALEAWMAHRAVGRAAE